MRSQKNQAAGIYTERRETSIEIRPFGAIFVFYRHAALRTRAALRRRVALIPVVVIGRTAFRAVPAFAAFYGSAAGGTIRRRRSRIFVTRDKNGQSENRDRENRYQNHQYKFPHGISHPSRRKFPPTIYNQNLLLFIICKTSLTVSSRSLRTSMGYFFFSRVKASAAE